MSAGERERDWYYMKYNRKYLAEYATGIYACINLRSDLLRLCGDANKKRADMRNCWYLVILPDETYIRKGLYEWMRSLFLMFVK